MLRSSPSGESQYELLNIPQWTRAREHSDLSDSVSSISRSSSQGRDLPVAKRFDGDPTDEQTFTAGQTYPPVNRRFFIPTVLRRRFFVLLASLFVLIAASLALLFALSKRSTGISSLNNHLYYVWTYGPTAVFTVISIVWCRLEFRAMQLWSWHLIQRNATSARDVVTDYTAFWNVWSMLRAIKRRHFRIVIVVLGSLLLNLLTVISTALFTNKSATLVSDAVLRLSTAVQPPGNLNMALVDALPYQETFLVIQLNTTPPLGTNGALMYETFFDDSRTPNITASFATNTSYTAQVKTLAMSMECESGTVIQDPRGNASELTALTIHSDSCTDTSIQFSLSYFQQGGDYGIFADLGCCGCGVDDAVLPPGNSYGPQFDNGLDWRLFVYANHFKTRQTSLNVTTLDNSDFISYICSGKVDSRLGNVTLARDSGTDQVLSHFVLGDSIDTGLNKSSGTQLLLAAYQSWYRFTSGGTAYNFLLNPGDDGQIPKFFNADFLLQKIQDSLPKLMAQVAAAYFTSESNNTVEGRTSTIANRLVLRDISFFLTMTALLMLCVICAFMALAKPLQSTSRDPSSLAAIAAILSRSPQLKSVLKETGPYSTEDLTQYISPVNVQSCVNADGSFNLACNQRSELFIDHRALKWWRPVTSTILFRILVIGAPLGLIVLLEACVQVSNRHGYLATVSTEGGPHYVWLYTFPLLFLGVRILFEMVSFNSKLFQPLHLLSAGNASASTSLLESLNGKVAIMALIKSLRHAYWAVAASSFAMLFGPFLSILVASLFVPVPASTSHEVAIRQIDRWNFSDPTGSLYYSPTWYPGIESRSSSGGITTYLGQDGVISSMILNYNLSFPKWTTNQFVLPTFEVLNTTESSGNTTTVQARLPAVRPVLNCEEASGRISWYSYNASFRGAGMINVNMTYDVSGLGDQNDNCGYGNNITINVNNDLQEFNGSIPPNYYYGETMDTRLSVLNLTTRTDCPTRVFFLSHLLSSTTKVLACRPQIQQVEVDVTLNYPDLSFSAQYPPTVVPGTPMIIQDRFFNSSHDVPYSDLPSGGSFSSVADPLHSSGLGDVFPSVDEVENALLGWGGNTFTQITSSFGPSLEDMFNDVQFMNDQLENIYGILVGQVLRSYGRENRAPSGNDPNQGNIKGTLITYNERVHLVDNVIVTRVLEGILALMTLCIIASMFLQHTRKVVPKDPEGIIAVMSLLAGAGPKFWDLFDRLDGAEWMSDKEMAEKGVFDGVKFRMGWSGGVPLDDRKGQYARVSGVDYNDEARERRWCVDVDEGPDSGIT